jgi:putative tricarboxylic transport membrane protein
MGEALNGLVYGLGVAFTPENALAALVGAMAGTILGVLPGLGPVAGAAILLPLTFTMSPTAALIIIAGIYYGVAYGGSTTAILLNIPGEVSSVVTAIDGYELTRQGRAGPALGITAIASFVAGTTSVLLVGLFSPLLARVGLLFGPAEYFALTLGGLILLSRIFGGSLASGLLPLVAGLALGTVGTEAVTGTRRFTGGALSLADGVSIVSLGIGVFGITELMFLVRSKSVFARPYILPVRFRDTVPTREDLRRATPPWFRGTGVGFVFGLLPGPSQAMSTFFSYRLEQLVGKNRRKLGSGIVEGVAAPEAANNAAATSSIVPLLALGIPFSATLAFMLTALEVQGITPGPLLSVQYPEVFWGVIASMLLGNVVLVFLNLNLISLWVRLLRVPYDILIPGLLALSIAGAFGGRHIIQDVLWVVPLALLGFTFRSLGFSLSPLLLGLILGPLVEKNLRESLFLSGGDVGFLLKASPLTVVMWLAVAIALAGGVVKSFTGKRRNAVPSAVEAD